MCEQDKSQIDEQEKYRIFLIAIGLISYLTLFIEVIWFLISPYPKVAVRNTLAIINFFALFFIAAFSLLVANEKPDVNVTIGKILPMIDRGKAVTIVFFIFLVCNVLYVFQDGGTRNSSISSILLVSTSFGFYFAKKKHIKYFIIAFCLFSYLLCGIFFFSYQIEAKDTIIITYTHKFFNAIPDFVVALFVIFINSIIEHQITKIKETIVDQNKQRLNLVPEIYTTDSRPENPSDGALWFPSANKQDK